LKHADLLKTGAGYVTQDIWKDWYQTFQRHRHESERESAIYSKLKKGPVFEGTIGHTIPRKALVEEIRQLTTPAGKGRHYPLVIGEQGTGKNKSDVEVAEAVRIGLGWSPDPVIDSSERNYGSSLLMNIT
jgi:hypothetical protein